MHSIIIFLLGFKLSNEVINALEESAKDPRFVKLKQKHSEHLFWEKMYLYPCLLAMASVSFMQYYQHN